MVTDFGTYFDLTDDSEDDDDDDDDGFEFDAVDDTDALYISFNTWSF